MDAVVHFEMPYDNVVATTTETGDQGPKRSGAINGGFYEKMLDRPMQYPSVVIAVDDVAQSEHAPAAAAQAAIAAKDRTSAPRVREGDLARWRARGGQTTRLAQWRRFSPNAHLSPKFEEV